MTLTKLYINYGCLSESEIKQLIKINKFYGGNLDIRNVNILLSLDIANLATNAGFGASFVNIITDLHNKIKAELISLPENIVEHTLKERG